MAKDLELREEAIDAAYRTLMDTEPTDSVEEAAERVYKLIGDHKDFLDLEEAINAYTAATERNGFKSGLLAGIRLSFDNQALEMVRGPRLLN